jgi:hypothetical protein
MGLPLLDRLARSPLGQKLLAEEARETATDRAAHAAERAALLKQLERVVPDLDAAVTEAMAKRDAARDALRDAERVLNAARQTRDGTVHQLERRIAEHEAYLSVTAPVLIAATAERLAAERDAICAEGSAAGATERAVTLAGQVVITASTWPSVKRRVLALGPAILAVRALGLENLAEAELTRRLEAIEAEIPEVVMESV